MEQAIELAATEEQTQSLNFAHLLLTRHQLSLAAVICWTAWSATTMAAGTKPRLILQALHARLPRQRPTINHR